jgi:predicted AAA+ superfamily ATPase
MGVSNFDQLIIQPWVGFSWEGFVIEQILSCLDSSGRNRQPYFFRTSDGHELDLVLLLNREIWAFEIKLSGSSGRKEMERLKRTSSMIGADKMVLISRTRKEIRGKHIISTHLAGILRLMSER